MRYLLAGLTLVATLVLGTIPAAAQAPAPGTELRGVLPTGLSTSNAYAGEDVILKNVASSDGRIQGATLSGTVDNVVKAGQGRPAQIRLHFRYLTLANGTTYPVDTIVTGMSAQTKSNALKEVGGGVGGMLVGNAIFKTLFGIAGGGLIGAAGGFLLAKNNRQNMTVPANSVVSVRVVRALPQATR